MYISGVLHLYVSWVYPKTQLLPIYTWEQIISKSEIDCMDFYQTFHFPKKDESGGYLARMQALSEEISLQSP